MEKVAEFCFHVFTYFDDRCTVFSEVFGINVLGGYIRALMGRIVRKKNKITSNMQHNKEEQ